MVIWVTVCKDGGEPGGGVWGFVADERGITVDDLLFVEGLGVPGAFLGVMWRDIGEQLHDTHPLVQIGELDGMTTLLVRDESVRGRLETVSSLHSLQRMVTHREHFGHEKAQEYTDRQREWRRDTPSPQ